MTILFLQTQDFRILSNKKGHNLCNQIHGFSIVMYKAENCELCRYMTEPFNQLSKKYGMWKFCMVDLMKNKNLIKMAEETLTQIKAVPLILIYYNGLPFLEYQGNIDPREFDKFLQELYLSKHVKHLQQISQNSNDQSQDPRNGQMQSSNVEQISGVIPYNFCDEESGLCFLTQRDLNEHRNLSINTRTHASQYSRN